MTESEWFACTDPQPMLEFLQDQASNRKFRLFGCACCRRVWQLLKDESSRTMVEEADWIADRTLAKAYPPKLIVGVLVGAARLAAAASANSDASAAEALAAYAVHAVSSLTGPKYTDGEVTIWSAWSASPKDDTAIDDAEQRFRDRSAP